MQPGSQDDALKQDLKKLIIIASERDSDPMDITDDESLIGFSSRLNLDSLDVLQINVAIANHFGVRIDDSKHARRVMKNINSLADFIQPGNG